MHLGTDRPEALVGFAELLEVGINSARQAGSNEQSRPAMIAACGGDVKRQKVLRCSLAVWWSENRCALGLLLL